MSTINSLALLLAGRDFNKRGEHGREEDRSSSSHFAANRWKQMDQKKTPHPHPPVIHTHHRLPRLTCYIKG
ncbi:hypothetical protein BHM03_00045164 [Ensete ventricosum]|nr:hypothetical protein BHM03_00045164 [Ensete ventricosum]